ncbi:MAG TPA: ETX/MTX2 family pore-forming toxin [Pyrinomonadaceae bacterium]|jgi:hypothetical protein
MAFTIEMTLRGILLAGKWRTEEELNHMLTEDKRNTLIVEMNKHSNQDVGHFQAMNDDALIGVGAVTVFLLESKIRSNDDLKTMSDDDQRNTLIVENNYRTDNPIPQLQGMSNKELVQMGLEWFAKSRTIAAILELYWKLDFAKVLETAPDVIETQTYDNRKSSHTPLKSGFTVEKEVSNSSSFSHEHGFEIAIGVETTFEAGIPLLARNETTVSVNSSTSHKWNFGKENSTKQKYSHQSNVEVPPHEHIQLIAQVTSGKLRVPYAAKIRAGDGSIQLIEGVWDGVSTTNLVVRQEDIV